MVNIQLFRRISLISLFAIGLAQTLLGQQKKVYGKGLSSPATLDGLNRLASRRWLVVVLDDENSSLSRSLFKLRSKNEDIFAYQFDIHVYPALKSPVANALMRREGWPTEPRWALINEAGAVICSGSSAPTPEAFLKTLKENGLKPYTEILLDFLRTHPDRVDALEKLFTLQLQVSMTRMLPFLLSTPKDKYGSFTAPTVSSAYTDREDIRVWEPFAKVLENYVEAEAWSDAVGFSGPRILTSFAACSPLMRETAQRLLPKVQETLFRYPSHEVLWTLWLALRNIGGGMSPAELLSELTPLPGSHGFPPEVVTDLIIREAMAAQDWLTVIGVMKRVWPEWRKTTLDLQAGPEINARVLQEQWDTKIGPLLEAYLRTGQVEEADKTVHEAIAWRTGTNFGHSASALARELGFVRQAEQWDALDSGKK